MSWAERFSIAGKTALVTGASSGIGAEIVRVFTDAGATVIVRCRIGEGADVCLSGPGVDGTLTVQIAGLPGGFWAARATRLRYPTGFDLFLVDGQTVLGIPRSTEVKEL